MCALDTTLVHLLEQRRDGRASEAFFHFLKKAPERRSLADLWEGAGRWAGRLQELGVGRGDRVAIVMHSTATVLEALFGALMRRAAVVPVAPFSGPVGGRRSKDRLVGAMQRTTPMVLVAPGEACTLARELIPPRSETTTIDLADAGERAVDPDAGRADDLAFVQLTSGSTGAPRGVALTHANVLANVHNIVHSLELTPEDRCVTWLPLHHDMGLIGTVLAMIYGGIPTAVLTPTAFVLHPERWLETLARFEGTYSVAPNFGYQLCVDRVSEEMLTGLDLSRWSRALNGAEPVRAKTLEAFVQRFGPCGFQERALLPVYGLAESTLAVAFPPLARGPRVDSIDEASLRSSGFAKPEPNGRTFVSVGSSFPDSELKIVDTATNEAVPERYEGEIVVRGPSMMAGYYGDPESTARIVRDDWLHTGDLGYLAAGELHITGRLKAVIIRAGEKFHAEDLEQAAESVTGIRRGCSAAFSIHGPLEDEVVVVVEARDEPGSDYDKLGAGVAEAVERAEGLRPDRVYIVPPRSVPKTTSGKVQRQDCRALLAQGTLRPFASARDG